MSEPIGRLDARTLLVVDDPALADLYEHWLSDRYRVESARKDDDLLAAVKTATVLVFDVNLLDPDERRMLASVQENVPDLPIGLVSGSVFRQPIDEMACQLYLRKPFGRELLQWGTEFLHTVPEQSPRTRWAVRRACEAAALSRSAPTALSIDDKYRLSDLGRELRTDRQANGPVKLRGMSNPLPEELRRWLE